MRKFLEEEEEIEIVKVPRNELLKIYDTIGEFLGKE